MDPVELAAQLIDIDSVNPSLVTGAAGESQVAAFCAQWMRDRGLEVAWIEPTPGRPSVVGVASGRGGGRSVILSGHLDTVGTATWPAGRRAVLDGDRLQGRGAYDMKGGIAAILTAAAAVSPERRGDVIVALVADEEFGSLGTEDVLRTLRADAAIIAEPSDLEVTVAHRGFAWFEIDIVGRAAHGSLPHQGIDAIAHARQIMDRLDSLAARVAARGAHSLLDPGTVRVAMIHGGVDAATVAPSCTLTVERRFLPSEGIDAVEGELVDALAGLLGDRASVRRLVARGAFEAASDSPIRALVRQQVAAVTGRAAVERGEPFWTDAGLFADAGIPTVLLGPVGGGPHADDEWVSAESVRQLAEALRRTADVFCA